MLFFYFSDLEKMVFSWNKEDFADRSQWISVKKICSPDVDFIAMQIPFAIYSHRFKELLAYLLVHDLEMCMFHHAEYTCIQVSPIEK